MLVAIGTLQHHITLKIWNKGDLKDPFFSYEVAKKAKHFNVGKPDFSK